MRLITVTILLAALCGSATGGPFLGGDLNRIDPLDPSAAATDSSLKSREAELRNKLETSSQKPYVQNELAGVLYERGQIREARELWDEAAAQEPNLAPADVEIVYALLDRGEASSARAALTRAASNHAGSFHVEIARGSVAVQQGDLEAAQAAFQKGAELAPQSYVAQLAWGRFLQLSGRMEEAVARFQLGTQLAPHRPEGWFLLALAEFNQDQIENSLQALTQAHQADADQPVAAAALGQFYLQINDLVGGRRWLRLAAEQTESPDVHLRLAQTEMALGRRDEARRVLTSVLDRETHFGSLIALAQLDEVERKYESAHQRYLLALKSDPTNPVVNNNLAMLCLQMGRDADEALQYADVAARQLPDVPEVMSTRACALAAAGQYGDARPLLKSLVRRMPQEPWVRFAYGRLLMHDGQAAEAHHHLSGCLMLDPEFPLKETISELLSEIEVAAR